MKKIIAFTLTFVLLISLVGCNNDNNVKSNLIGEWYIINLDGTKSDDFGYIFNEDGTAAISTYGSKNHGTYVIEDGNVILTTEDGKSVSFEYAHEDGEFKLKIASSDRWNLYKK